MKKLLVLPFLLGCNLYSFEQYYQDHNLNSPSAPDAQHMQPGQSVEGRQNPPPRPPLPPRNSLSVRGIDLKKAELEAVLKHLADIYDHIIEVKLESLKVYPWTKKKINKKAAKIKNLGLGALNLIYFEKVALTTKEEFLQEQTRIFQETIDRLCTDVVENSSSCLCL